MLTPTLQSDQTCASERAILIELVSQYAQTMDRQKWDRHRLLFEDSLDMSYPEWANGPVGIMAADEWLYLVRRLLMGFEVTQHILFNHIVEIDGDKARVEVQMTARHIFTPGDENGEECLGGYYTFHTIKTSGRWRIAGIHLVTTWDRGPRELFQRAWERGEGK